MLKKHTRSPMPKKVEADITKEEEAVYKKFLYSVVTLDRANPNESREHIALLMELDELFHCDAAFLEVSMRTGCPLITRDKDLAEAAYEANLLHHTCEAILYTPAKELACVDMGEFEEVPARLNALRRGMFSEEIVFTEKD